MADEFPRTAAYKKLVDKGLIKVDKDLPQYVQDVSKDLQGNARTGELEDAIAKVCERIREIDSSAVFDVEGFEGNRQEAKDFLQDILKLAEAGNIRGAGDALKSKSIKKFSLNLHVLTTMQR
jgi:polyhydroxyalkanoate synthesis regulator phasin